MRSVELAKVAAAAEALRLRRFARRQGIRAAYAAVALLFALAAFSLLHFTIYQLIALALPRWASALIVFVFDLVVTGALGYVALNSKPDRVEREALVLRRESIEGAKRAFTVWSVLGTVGGMALRADTRRALGGRRLDRVLLIAELAGRYLRHRRR